MGSSERRRSALRRGSEAAKVEDECGVEGKEITAAPFFIKRGEAAVTD